MQTSSIGLEIIRQTKGKIPALPFEEIKNHILGKKYFLSLVFPTTKIAEDLHLKWKNLPGPANILSFPLSENSGEIFIHLGNARREAKNFGYNYNDYLIFLFIHGLFHLKGFDHGSKMEEQEVKARIKFGIKP